MDRPALLLVDVQEDFLARPGLTPHRAELCARMARLLAEWRAQARPVLHVQTRVRADGADSMPHWKRDARRECIEGTPGAQAPIGLEAADGEPVFVKRFYGAFGADGLAEALAARNCDGLVVAGLYLEACVRQTVLEAYERGLEVWVAEDAVGSTDPIHGELSRSWLSERAARFVDAEALAAQFGGARVAPPACETFPVGWIAGSPQAPGAQHASLTQFRPADRARPVGRVPLAERADVAEAARTAATAGAAWAERSESERGALLGRWRTVLERRADDFVDRMVAEIGKPRSEARAEFARALAHVDTARRVVSDTVSAPAENSTGSSVRYRPRGTVALVTPWNNPVAIPVGKLAPALGFGNAVVWKPTTRAPGCARAIVESLREADTPAGLVSVVFGEAETARYVIQDPCVDAVSVTGSIQTGQRAAALCARDGKPLQAELGGNNAAIVLADADLKETATSLAAAAFGFAGQRCTATRRIIVEERIAERFRGEFVDAIAALRIGEPDDLATQVGPLISEAHRTRIKTLLERALAQGARVLCGGDAPKALEHGCYFRPTLVEGLTPHAELVQEESFGPIAVLLLAADLEEALRLANDVPQGLLASLHTRDAAARRRFDASVQAGILKHTPGALAVDPDAPFGGWKRSGIGPPEHGPWDREFYTRVQAVYA